MYTPKHIREALKSSVDLKVRELGDETSPDTCMCPQVKESLKKRSRGYKDVEVVQIRKLRIYYKEKFDFSKVITRNEKDGVASVDVVTQTAPGCALEECLVCDGDPLEDFLDEDNGDLLPRRMDFGDDKRESFRAVVVMPENKIKDRYVEGDTLNELKSYLTVPFHLKNAYRIQKKIKGPPIIIEEEEKEEKK